MKTANVWPFTPNKYDLRTGALLNPRYIQILAAKSQYTT
jgi:hypothetical protein